MPREQSGDGLLTSARKHLSAVKGIVTAIAALAVVGGGFGTYLIGLSHLNTELDKARTDTANYKTSYESEKTSLEALQNQNVGLNAQVTSLQAQIASESGAAKVLPSWQQAYSSCKAQLDTRAANDKTHSSVDDLQKRQDEVYGGINGGYIPTAFGGGTNITTPGQMQNLKDEAQQYQQKILQLDSQLTCETH